MTYALPEWKRITDPYFWFTAYVIARNAVLREYQNAYLGMLWTLFLPLIQVMMYAWVMPMIMARPVTNYALYLVVSFPLWAFLSNTLVQACHSIISQAETIKRCMVSSAVFPIADVWKQGYHYLVSFGVMYAVLLLWQGGGGWYMLWLPVLLFPLLVTLMAAAIAVAYLAPYVRDVGYAVHMLVTLLFWCTPVIYPLELIPPEYRVWFEWNPFYILMHPIQELLVHGRLADTDALLALCGLSSLSVLVSLIIYRCCRRNYVYYL